MKTIQIFSFFFFPKNVETVQGCPSFFNVLCQFCKEESYCGTGEILIHHQVDF